MPMMVTTVEHIYEPRLRLRFWRPRKVLYTLAIDHWGEMNDGAAVWTESNARILDAKNNVVYP
jgi:hypothetical protein